MYEKMYAMIENTTLCGANCVMCPRTQFRHRFETMPFSTYKKIVDEICSNGCNKIGICGFGDSLCDTGLSEKLSYVKRMYPDVYLSTINTGHLLDTKNIDMVCQYFDIVKISMYGITKETYEKIHRGTLIFEQVKDNIDRFLLEAKRRGVYTILTFLVMPENEHEMEAWREYYEPRCDRVDIWKPHNWGGSKRNDKPILNPCPRVMNCNDLQFCTDGSVTLCCFDFNRNNTIGNINEKTLREILAGERLKKIQEIHRLCMVRQSDLICKDCDQIRNRADALIYSTEKKMKVGMSSMIDYGNTI